MRTYRFGYTYTKFKNLMGKLPDLKPDAKIDIRPQRVYRRAPAVAASLGVHVLGLALPAPSTSDCITQAMGARKRFASAVPPFVPKMQRAFRSFVRMWLQRNMAVLPSDTDYTVEHWLSRAPYSQARKDELLASWNACNRTISRRHYRNKMFTKHEDYTTWKQARCINSRTDQFKCLTGPYFHAIEQLLFRTKNFIKFVPVRGRPRFIRDRLQSTSDYYACTDHSAFESHMTPEVLKACEFQLYRHVLGQAGRPVLGHIFHALAGTNTCVSRGCTVTLKGARMSGDMCTSLGNGFTNMMTMFFMCSQKHLECDGIFEGDDGITRISGKLEDLPTVDDFKAIGMDLKLKYVSDLASADFCGLVSHPKVLENLADPNELLVKFGWTMSTYMHSKPAMRLRLLRAKAYSLAFELPHCPIAAALASYALRVTTGVKPLFQTDHSSKWWEQQLLSFEGSGFGRLRKLFTELHREIPIESREVVRREFNVPIAHQLKVEAYLNSLHTLTPLPTWVVHSFDPSWSLAYDLCVRTCPCCWRDVDLDVTSC